MMRATTLGLTVVGFLAMACGSSVSEESAGTGGGATGGAGGTDPGPLTVVSVRAPDEYTVKLVLSGEPPAAATEVSLYSFAGEGGALVVQSAAIDAATKTVTLTTAKQKLGVSYDVALTQPNGPLDGLHGTFLAADKATFWVVDLSSASFPQYQITAVRDTIGTHSVVYLEEGMTAYGVTDAVTLFDGTTFGTETALFHAAPDRDGNGRLVLLGLDGKGAYGGYFDPTNTMTDAQAVQQTGYHSNEMEILHINIEAGDFDYWQVIVAHEFQHLLNQEQQPWNPWNYHNEGLSECAVHAVLGHNDLAVQQYVDDPSGGIANGESLVQWTYSNYDQYAIAYLYWTYIASQLGGVQGYGQLFDLDGSPAAIQTFLQANLGRSFTEVERDMLLAARVQAPNGVHGFSGMVTFPGLPPVSNASSLNLHAFAGTFLALGAGVTSVDYPTTQGPDIVYAGVTGAGAVDLTAPFDVTGGVLLVLNTKFDPNTSATQPSGPSLMPPPAQTAHPSLGASPASVLPNGHSAAWLHPPPFDAFRLERMRAWHHALFAKE